MGLKKKNQPGSASCLLSSVFSQLIVAETSVTDGLGFCYWAGRCSLIYIFSPGFSFPAFCQRTLMKEKAMLGPMSRSKGLGWTFICQGFWRFFFWVEMYRKKKCYVLFLKEVYFLLLYSFQIPQCYPDHVPTHLALPHHRSHHKQGCSQASPGSEGLGQGHTAGA